MPSSALRTDDSGTPDPARNRPRIAPSATNLMHTWGKGPRAQKGSPQRTGKGERNMIYDSEVDTRLHIDRVRFLLSQCAINLLERGLRHDASKLEPPEK